MCGQDLQLACFLYHVPLLFFFIKLEVDICARSCSDVDADTNSLLETPATTAHQTNKKNWTENNFQRTAVIQEQRKRTGVTRNRPLLLALWKQNEYYNSDSVQMPYIYWALCLFLFTHWNPMDTQVLFILSLSSPATNSNSSLILWELSKT